MTGYKAAQHSCAMLATFIKEQLPLMANRHTPCTATRAVCGMMKFQTSSTDSQLPGNLAFNMLIVKKV